MSDRNGGFYHSPVMLSEVLEWLGAGPGSVVVDVTLGGGGHADALLKEISPDGVLIGIDRDPDALKSAGERLSWAGDRVKIVKGTFGNLVELLGEIDVDSVDGIVADLGVSSFQFDAGDRGFSFRTDAPLDMRMDPSTGESAADLIERLSESEIRQILIEFGEERFPGRIATALFGAGRIETTGELAKIVERVVPGRRGKIHPATQTFQALRIAVNDELGELNKFLDNAPGCLKPGGRMVVISYHSLEDRRVKRSFAARAKSDGFSLPRRKVVMPERKEILENSRARSAKLRVLERVVG
jgi:16S rRNA (cytosine1402-N4)-methyltransferase